MVVHVASGEVVLVGHLDAVEGDRDAEGLGGVPEGVIIGVVPGKLADGVAGQDEGHGAEIVDCELGFLDGEVDVVHGDEGAELEDGRVGVAVVPEP